ncbi:MAG: ABC transporter ATP-binding protein [Lachnospiraceae bacterium]|nr:ABC transporter ATP-binding protein [Lachnospiraceae bacterium]
MSRILTVSGVNAYYKAVKPGKSKKERVQILKDISFEMEQGEILGLVGESGCGKSTLAKTILSMIKDYDGEISCTDEHPQMIFQDPYGSLNPSKKIGWILQEPLRNLTWDSAHERYEKAVEMLNRVGLEEKYMEHYPHQLSGGQRQRVCIAAALMLHPGLVLADEPVSALDVTIQRQVLELLLKLKREMSLSILFISHDLRVVYQLCDRVMIMEKGEIVEQGKTEEVYFQPKHEYTKRLLEAAEILGEDN